MYYFKFLDIHNSSEPSEGDDVNLNVVIIVIVILIVAIVAFFIACIIKRLYKRHRDVYRSYGKYNQLL